MGDQGGDDRGERDGLQPGREPDPEGRRCPTCGIKLSAYNPGPHCWSHTIGWPWRGPSAKPHL